MRWLNLGASESRLKSWDLGVGPHIHQPLGSPLCLDLKLSLQEYIRSAWLPGLVSGPYFRLPKKWWHPTCYSHKMFVVIEAERRCTEAKLNAAIPGITGRCGSSNGDEELIGQRYCS